MEMMKRACALALSLTVTACGGTRVAPLNDAVGEASGGDELPVTVAYAGYLDSWDLDGNGMIDGEEFGNLFGDLGAFDGWDFDGSGLLAPHELESALESERWLSRVEDRPAAWDADADGTVGRTELRERVFRHWDADRDGILARSEALLGIRTIWDVDGDGRLSPEERAALHAWLNRR